LRLGLYSPYFGTVWGGGEKYLACTARALQDARPADQVEILAPVPVDPRRCTDMLGVDLAGIAFRSTNRRVTPLHRSLNRVSALRPLRDRVLGAQATRAGRAYDFFLPMVYGIPVAAQHGRAAMLCQFPYREAGPELAAYGLIVCQSEYVRSWVREYWGREAAVVNPPIDVPAGPPDWSAKKQVILSVGRFFSGGHSKRQEVLVAAFRRLVDAGLSGWELHLAGTVHRDAHHAGYYESVGQLARGYPIRLHPDAPGAEVRRLYESAALYWHAAGYGADPQAQPERLEHFGMTTAEAMGHGAVPVVFAAGGQLEVVEEGVSGRLWHDLDRLESATRELVGDAGLRRRLGAAAYERSQRWARPRFAAEIVAALEPVLP
jgi:glycosyltransferase involved in cell wall biosynthesis